MRAARVLQPEQEMAEMTWVLDLGGVERAHLLRVGGRQGLLLMWRRTTSQCGCSSWIELFGDVGVLGHDSPPGSVLRILVRS